MDEEALTSEEAAWIVANRDQIRESGGPTGMVISLEGEDAVHLLAIVFGNSDGTGNE